jgi:predicted RNase H-like HicB family nuclease
MGHGAVSSRRLDTRDARFDNQAQRDKKGGLQMKLAYETICALSGEDTYTIEIQSLQGCGSQANGIDHSIKMAAEAASVWVLSALEKGQPIPESKKTTEEDMRHFKDPIVRTVEIDIESFARMHAKEITVKTIEIPTWLNTIADQAQMDLPEALQSTIIQSMR